MQWVLDGAVETKLGVPVEDDSGIGKGSGDEGYM